jgi:hypothetical protein
MAAVESANGVGPVNGERLPTGAGRHPVPAGTAAAARLRQSDRNGPALETPARLHHKENAMRLVDVVLASLLLGLALGYLNMDTPDAAKAGAAGTGQATSEGGLRGRTTWLRTPGMHAPTQVP